MASRIYAAVFGCRIGPASNAIRVETSGAVPSRDPLLSSSPWTAFAGFFTSFGVDVDAISRQPAAIQDISHFAFGMAGTAARLTEDPQFFAVMLGWRRTQVGSKHLVRSSAW